MATTLTTAILRRSAEVVRWNLSGREGNLDESRFEVYFDHFDGSATLYATKEDGRFFVKIQEMDLLRSLDDVGQKFIEPFVRELPSVKASAHARAEAARQRGEDEYKSWGAP